MDGLYWDASAAEAGNSDACMDTKTFRSHVHEALTEALFTTRREAQAMNLSSDSGPSSLTPTTFPPIFPPSNCKLYRQQPRLSRDRAIPASHHERPGFKMGANSTVLLVEKLVQKAIGGTFDGYLH